jgi:type IV pilus assembly protein PilM
MSRSRPANFVGLTIEPGRIAAARVSVNGSICIEDGGTAELEPGVVRDGEVADADALTDGLRRLWREHPDLDKKVRIGVANARIVVRTLHVPPISDPKQLASAVQFLAAESIPMPLADAILDHHAVGIVETPDGPRERVILVAARRDMINDMLTAVRAAGLKPAGIDLSAFGMVRALQRQRRASDGPELFVAVGGLTNLAISEHGVCGFTRVAGGGLESLAVELAERRELTAQQARTWLQRVGLEAELGTIDGDASIAADAREILMSGVRRIATEIRASLDFQQGRAEDGTAAAQRVVLTGPAVAVAGFAPALEAELGLEVQARVVDSSEQLKLGPLDAGCLSVAAGLAVEGKASS